ncbi:MAG: enoyl-CoA hydratase/isomerase family protein [Firmicutes bacterium]|nr:enoyl-CoA hydratase/isomerase family protein [Bacillota bacterium]
MMTNENLILSDKADGIAWITLNRPDSMNALTPLMLTQLNDALVAAREDEEVGVIVVTGSGRAFCAGLDLKALGKTEFSGGEVEPKYIIYGLRVIDTIIELPKVVIAMVNGFCFTGGLEILLAFDLIVAAEEAYFGDTHARWGIRPSWGMSQRLPRIVGINKAKELSFTARKFTAQEAREMGMVNRVVAADKLKQEVTALAEDILANSLDAVAAIKNLYNRGLATTLKEGLDIEANSHFQIADTNQRLKDFMRK